MPKAKEKEEKAVPLIILCGLGGALAWLFLRKPRPPQPASLYGIVTDVLTGMVIPGIDVECNGYTAVTDSNGSYAIDTLEGSYTVTFTDPANRYLPETLSIQLSAHEDRELNITLVPMEIPVAIFAAVEAKYTLQTGDDPATEWLKLQNANVGTVGNMTFPAAWWYPPWRNIGIRRAILFFDTTVLSAPEDMTLHLFNSKSGAPCYYGDKEYYIISGNGAPPEFGGDIYGWIRDRFSQEYFIASKAISAISCRKWGEFHIPAQFVNVEGYTVLICVSAHDFNAAASYGELIGYLDGGMSYLSIGSP